MLKKFKAKARRFQQGEDSPTIKMNNKKKMNQDNPYYTSGIDKFSKVVAELCEKRQEIYRQISSPEVCAVRFGYSYSKDWTPIVVKFNNKTKIDHHLKPQMHANDIRASNNEVAVPQESQVKNVIQVEQQQQQRPRQPLPELEEPKKGLLSLSSWRNVYDYLSTIVMFILLFLAVYGREFVLVCTSMWCYVVSLLRFKSRAIKKKDVVRRFMSLQKMENEVNNFIVS